MLSLYNEVKPEGSVRLQAVIGQTEAKSMLEAIADAVGGDEECRKALYVLWRGLGFHIGLLDPDSDGDGASDGREISWGTDPHHPDSDRDGILDGEAILSGRDPLNPIQAAPNRELLRSIHDGPFKGSRVVETTTAPDLSAGEARLLLQFSPDDNSLPNTDNLVFVQVFRRTAVKMDGFRIPILPSLYIEYAGSPELDMHTIECKSSGRSSMIRVRVRRQRCSGPRQCGQHFRPCVCRRSMRVGPGRR